MAPTAQVTSWSAMGTTARVWFAGASGDGAVRTARDRLSELEARWSRFLPGSDVSRINQAGGRPVTVHVETLELLDTACAWWSATDGRFDPTVGRALCAAGYDRDRALGHGPVGSALPAPGFDVVEIDRERRTVRVPAGVGIDLGGIGKGRAVDLVAGELDHLAGGLVDLGGDLRVWGESPSGQGWPISVEDLRDGTELALLGLIEGAVATSSTLRRRWSDGHRSAHHLIDPRTGRPTDSEVVSVTVVGARATGSEVLAKAALLAGTVAGASALLNSHHVAAIVVPAAGAPLGVGAIRELCWTASPELW